MKIHIGWLGIIVILNIVILYYIQDIYDVGYIAMYSEAQMNEYAVLEKTHAAISENDISKAEKLITALKEINYETVHNAHDELAGSVFSFLVRGPLKESASFLAVHKKGTSDLTTNSSGAARSAVP